MSQSHDRVLELQGNPWVGVKEGGQVCGRGRSSCPDDSLLAGEKLPLLQNLHSSSNANINKKHSNASFYAPPPSSLLGAKEFHVACDEETAFASTQQTIITTTTQVLAPFPVHPLPLLHRPRGHLWRHYSFSQ